MEKHVSHPTEDESLSHPAGRGGNESGSTALLTGVSLLNWLHTPDAREQGSTPNAMVEMGWGRLIFGHTFADDALLVQTICEERPLQRDVTMYARDPHVLVSMAPDRLFLDPSHTFRLWHERYRPGTMRYGDLPVRRAVSPRDTEEINRIYSNRHMVSIEPGFIERVADDETVVFVVVEDPATGQIIGTAAGVDHRLAFNDPDNGASIWSVAADGQTPHPGIGKALLRHLVEGFFAKGRRFVDLSVMHDNAQAIALYERLGFERVPAFCIKHKNAINEPLFVPSPPEGSLNPYARIITDEARRRGIAVEVLDEEANYFALTCGGRRVVCRESLSELTSAIAMSRCDDKRVTRRVLQGAGLSVPAGQTAGAPEENLAFLERHGRVVVKPVRGEQGKGISVDVRTPGDLERAIELARREADTVLLEEFCEGIDLRIVVIGYKVVAAAVRRPAEVVGTGRHTLEQLIEQQSRKRMAATGGESRIPMDAETRRCVEAAGYTMDSTPHEGEVVRVRKAANLHTGGTIHDVTDRLHPALAEAAVRAARAIEIPVTGLDFLAPDVEGPDYVIIEANERPGLANHEPQPTAQRFVDLLFPQTAAEGNA